MTAPIYSRIVECNASGILILGAIDNRLFFIESEYLLSIGWECGIGIEQSGIKTDLVFVDRRHGGTVFNSHQTKKDYWVSNTSFESNGFKRSESA